MTIPKFYYRPLVQTGQARPSSARRLAGGWTWFDTVEVLSRGRPPHFMSANDLPEDVENALCAPRSSVAGLDLSRPNLMGILNVTPDSFSDGGLFNDPVRALKQAQKMVSDGADIIDIGGESTRPGADFVPSELEINRTKPVIGEVRAGADVPISIDTRKSDVAQAALNAGANLINDVSAFTHDAKMLGVVAQTGAPVCLMHAQGDPKVMQDHPDYDDVLLDVFDFLKERIDFAIKSGVSRHQIIVDPGIGFGKKLPHNLALLNRISLFHALGCPILLGASRKRFIGTIAHAPDAHDRAPGSIAVSLAAITQGVQINRVHDIKQTKQALALWQAVSSGEFSDDT